MSRSLLTALVLFAAVGVARAGDGLVLDTMDTLHFRGPADKARAELVEGKLGRAIRFTFPAGARGVFFSRPLHGTPAWDRTAGLSFWLKGDGSEHLGGLELIYDEDYAVRYDFAFPLRNAGWTKIVVPWRDLVPVLPGPRARPLDPATGNKPSRLTALAFGKWWYWGDYPAHSFTVDEIRLEEHLPLDTRDYKPAGLPLARVRARLKAGQPVTVVTMGDSLTDFRHWANRATSWPLLLQKQIEGKYSSRVRLVNPAIGGTQLRQNLILMPRWLPQAPEPDLVTVCFGANDWDAGMRGPAFREACADAVDRIRRATHGKADVLILTTVPSASRWGVTAELADACRQAARDRNAGLADTARAFQEAGPAEREKLFAWDRTHLSPAGYALVARTVRQAIGASGQ